MRFAGLALMLAVSAIRAAEPQAENAGQPASAIGHWEGTFDEDDSKYGLKLDFEIGREGGLQGSATIPYWGDSRFPLKDVSVTGSEISFSLKDDLNGPSTFSATMDEHGLRGRYKWGDRSTPFSLVKGRDPASDGPRQPQLPSSPLPYSVKSVRLTHDRIELAGGLTVPADGAARHTAVLILGGSVPGTWHPRIPGPVDEGAWTWVLADALTREGIVTLSLDSRGYGGSSGSYSSATRDDLAADAAAALKYLRSCEEVAPGRVGLLGCSQGGLVATRCAVGTDKPDFVVLMNTPCLPVDEVFMESARKIHEATGADPKQTARYLALRSEVLALVKTDRPEAEVRQYITGKYPAAVLRKLRMDGPMLTSLLDWSLTPITRSFIKYDPRPDLIRLQTPVFLLQGECDLHVPARQNVDAVNRLRGENQLTTFTVSVIPDMNHSFQRTKGLEVIGDDTIDPQVPSLIAAWINRTIVK